MSDSDEITDAFWDEVDAIVDEIALTLAAGFVNGDNDTGLLGKTAYSVPETEPELPEHVELTKVTSKNWTEVKPEGPELPSILPLASTITEPEKSLSTLSSPPPGSLAAAILKTSSSKAKLSGTENLSSDLSESSSDESDRKSRKKHKKKHKKNKKKKKAAARKKSRSRSRSRLSRGKSRERSRDRSHFSRKHSPMMRHSPPSPKFQPKRKDISRADPIAGPYMKAVQDYRNHAYKAPSYVPYGLPKHAATKIYSISNDMQPISDEENWDESSPSPRNAKKRNSKKPSTPPPPGVDDDDLSWMDKLVLKKATTTKTSPPAQVVNKITAPVTNDDDEDWDVKVPKKPSSPPKVVAPSQPPPFRRPGPKSQTKFRSYAKGSGSDEDWDTMVAPGKTTLPLKPPDSKTQEPSPKTEKRASLPTTIATIVDTYGESSDDLEAEPLGPVKSTQNLSEDTIRIKQDEDPKLKKIKDILISGKSPDDETKAFMNDFKTMTLSLEGLLHREIDDKMLIWIPEVQINDVIESRHILQHNVHLSYGRTIKSIEETYFWPYMLASVRDFMTKCPQCSRNNKKRDSKAGDEKAQEVIEVKEVKVEKAVVQIVDEKSEGECDSDD